MLWFLPETSHPGSRGVDKLELGARKWVVLNPLKSLGLLRSPNLFAVTLVASFALIGLFGIVMPWRILLCAVYLSMSIVQFTSHIQGARYEIKNEAVLAIFFSAAGFGNIREFVSSES
jgi:hypothetical protein